MSTKSRGFTLIELLIVVAIIAILAAIAVPNFLEAQVRSKVARVKTDLRTHATAIESYAVDWNTLPKDSDSDFDSDFSSEPGLKANGSLTLTTPISYLTTVLTDPFSAGSAVGFGMVGIGYRIGSGTWSYNMPGEAPKDSQNSYATMQAKGKIMAYVTLSPGPDKERCRMSYKCFPWKPVTDTDSKPGLPSFYQDYDPTNGTVSGGDIYRFGGQYMSGNWDRNAIGRGPAGPDSL